MNMNQRTIRDLSDSLAQVMLIATKFEDITRLDWLRGPDSFATGFRIALRANFAAFLPL